MLWRNTSFLILCSSLQHIIIFYFRQLQRYLNISQDGDKKSPFIGKRVTTFKWSYILLLAGSEKLKTDVHIIGVKGQQGESLAERLLAAESSSASSGGIDLGIVYGYRTTHRLQGSVEDYHSTFFNGKGNATFIPRSMSKCIEIVSYDTLSDLQRKLTQREAIGKDQGRRSILVYANRCNLNDFQFDKNTLPSYENKNIRDAFSTSVLSEDYTSSKEFELRWQQLKEQWETLKKIEQRYAETSFQKYKEAVGSGLSFDLETVVKRIIAMRKEQFPSAVLAVKEIAHALQSAGDLVVLVSNPVDITTAVYAAVSGRDPETIFCPVDNDRLRLCHALADILLVSFDSFYGISAIGSHDHWNMLLEQSLTGHHAFSSLSSDKRKEILYATEIHANKVALNYAQTRSRTATDYEEVLFQAVSNAMDSEMSGPVKLILYDSNQNIFTGWMGRVGNMRAVREGMDMIPGNQTASEQKRSEMGISVVKEVIEQLDSANIIPRIDPTKSRTHQEFIRSLEQIPRTYTTQVHHSAKERRRLSKGEYFMTTYYQGNQPHLAFMKQEGHLFTVVSLVPLERDKIPRALLYDAKTKELYSAHRSGIDALSVTQLNKPLREVLRLDELPKLAGNRTDPVGVTSLLFNDDKLLFTIPGYGIGTIARKHGAYSCPWKEIARYEIKEHVDALQLVRSSSEPYVALSGNNLIFGDGKKWTKHKVTDGTLEALVACDNALLAIATVDNAVEFIDWSCTENGVVRTQQLEYTLKAQKLQRKLPLHTAVGYRMRLKAAATPQQIMAVLYDGTAFYREKGKREFVEIAPFCNVTNAFIGIDALCVSAAPQFIISGDVTKGLRFVGDALVQDDIFGFGYYTERQSNPARYLATITIA